MLFSMVAANAGQLCKWPSFTHGHAGTVMSASPRISTTGFTISELIRESAQLSLGIRPADMAPRVMETPVCSGRLLAHEVYPGLTATANDISYLAEHELSVEMESALLCGLVLRGESDTMNIDGFGPVTKRLEQPTVIGFRRNARFRRICKAPNTSCAAGFILKPAFFDRFGDSVTDDGLVELRDFLSGDFRAETLPRSTRLIEIGHRNLNHPYNGQLGELFLESNTLSFVIEIAELLKQERRLVAQLGRRHYDRVMEARDILDANLVAPPQTLDLARQIGVNITTLQDNFKKVFGTTIFGYVRTQRLLMARVLLLDYRLSVAEAGYRVGFASPAAFTAAYRRHFGHPPGKETAREHD